MSTLADFLTIQYSTIQYNTIQYNTVQYNTIQYNTIQYNTIQLCPLVPANNNNAYSAPFSTPQTADLTQTVETTTGSSCTAALLDGEYVVGLRALLKDPTKGECLEDVNPAALQWPQVAAER